MKKHLAYFGCDPDFIKELKNYVYRSGVGDYEIKEFDYKKDSLVQVCTEILPQIVYIDFTSDLNIKDVLNEVLYIKNNPLYGGILFTAVCSKQESLNELKALKTNGFQLFFIKGCESKKLFMDSFYVAFDESNNFPVYATAKKIDLPIKTLTPSVIKSLNSTSFILETDYETSGSTLEMTLPFFPDLKCTTFEIKDHLTSKPSAPMITSYEVQLPLSSAWNDVDEQTLQEDTLTTWFGNNEEKRVTDKVQILIYTQNRGLFLDLFKTYDSTNFDLLFHDHLDQEHLVDHIKSNQSHLVFFDLEISTDESKNLEKLKDLTTAFLGSDNPLPIIVSTNNPSKTQAIQKLLNYGSLLCYEKPLNSDIFTALSKNYLLKRKVSIATDYTFDPRTNESIVSVQFDILLTSLNEHEITFFSEIPIPMFSLLEFKLPIPFVATVVPSLTNLPSRANAKQYMAFINGIDEKGSEILRKFINQIIYHPLADFSEESIHLCLDKLSIEKQKKEVLIEEKVASTVIKEEPEPVLIKRKNITGKSKL